MAGPQLRDLLGELFAGAVTQARQADRAAARSATVGEGVPDFSEHPSPPRRTWRPPRSATRGGTSDEGRDGRADMCSERKEERQHERDDDRDDVDGALAEDAGLLHGREPGRREHDERLPQRDRLRGRNSATATSPIARPAANPTPALDAPPASVPAGVVDAAGIHRRAHRGRADDGPASCRGRTRGRQQDAAERRAAAARDSRRSSANANHSEQVRPGVQTPIG